MRVCMHVYIHVYKQTNINTLLQLYIKHTNTQTYTHIRTHTFAHIHTHTYMRARVNSHVQLVSIVESNKCLSSGVSNPKVQQLGHSKGLEIIATAISI